MNRAFLGSVFTESAEIPSIGSLSVPKRFVSGLRPILLPGRHSRLDCFVDLGENFVGDTVIRLG